MLFSKHTISVESTSLFSDLFNDYLTQSENIKPFYEQHIKWDDFDAYMQKQTFDYIKRSVLVKALQKQANLISNTSVASQTNINLLEQTSTYTITTGHQLCLFTGPLYFIYKIISTLNLCKTLHQKFPDKKFVPVYWMASEDHDFDEINHTHVYGKKITWDTTQKGCVGEFDTKEIKSAIAELKLILGENTSSNSLIQLFEDAYLKHHNLADATRFLVNALFGDYGIVILDGNDCDLKHLFKKEFNADVFENSSFKMVNNSITELKKNYSIQVTPRPINVFYKDYQARERIEKQEDTYKVLNTNICFSEEEMKHFIDNSSEKLSPNVVMRPLYQQKILPNICYVGGPGEIAYWLEYKAMFNHFGIHFPILMPRHFVMIIDKNSQSKIQKLNFDIKAVFEDGDTLVKQLIKHQHQDVNLNDTKQELVRLYESILETVSNIDKSLIGTTEAEKQKTMNGISIIEQKINRALKQKSDTDIQQIWALKDKLFPKNLPQERHDNFSMYYSKFGKEFITELIKLLDYDLINFEYTILKEL